MKIAHIGLASHYTDGMTYQDNMLAEQNARDGHEVLYISDAQRFENGKLTPVGHQEKMLPCGVRLVYLPYRKVLTASLSDKLRKVSGLYTLLCGFQPDVILCHGLYFYSVTDVIRYKKENPRIKLYADTHADYGNSGTNALSRHILHGIYYKALFQKALPYVEKVLCTSPERRDFVMEVYGCPEEKTELYPLGGVIPPEEEYRKMRSTRRRELSVSEEELLFVHSGKLDAGKKTEELLNAFYAVPELKAKLIIAGSVPDDRKDVLLPLMERDGRVVYLGWLTADRLSEYLCAGDLYLQPGTVSATMEYSMCCRCAEMLYPTSAYTRAFPEELAFWVKSEEDILAAFRSIAADRDTVQRMRERVYSFALENLDYRKLAARLYR